METGNSNHNYQSLNLSACKLLVHIRQDGASAILVDSLSNDVVKILIKSWLATNRLSKLKEYVAGLFSDHELIVSDCASVNYVLSLPKFTLIPDILYHQGSGSTILASSARLESEDQVFSDFLSHRDSVLIYSIEESFHNFLKESNSNTQIAHNGYALNALSLKLGLSQSRYLLMISDSFAELFITENGKLIFYNQFPHDVPEDLLYYVLFALEQNRIIATEIEVKIIIQTESENNPFKTLLATYLGSVEELPLKPIVAHGHHYSKRELRAITNLLALL